MDNLKGKEILDMGCGSGIVSIAASSKGAIFTAVDINPEAVKCANENFKLNRIDAKAIESNLFKNIENEKKFDIVFFNPPYYDYEPKNDFERGFGGGKNYRVIRDFIRHSREHLAKHGFICIIVSSDMNVNTLFSILEENVFGYNILQRIDRFFETFYIVKGFLKSTPEEKI